MPKFKVSVQYRSVRSVTVSAPTKEAAIEKAAGRIERTGDEVIACSAEPTEERK